MATFGRQISCAEYQLAWCAESGLEEFKRHEERLSGVLKLSLSLSP